MRSLKERMYSFLYGRNGPDELYKFCLYSCFALLILNFILGLFRVPAVVTRIISIAELALLGYSIFRLLSKNVYKRRAENEAFLKIKRNSAVFGWFRLCINRFKYRKTHIYTKCPQCRRMLRLPRVSGNHGVRCPGCGNNFDITIR